MRQRRLLDPLRFDIIGIKLPKRLQEKRNSSTIAGEARTNRSDGGEVLGRAASKFRRVGIKIDLDVLAYALDVPRPLKNTAPKFTGLLGLEIPPRSRPLAFGCANEVFGKPSDNASGMQAMFCLVRDICRMNSKSNDSHSHNRGNRQQKPDNQTS